MSAKALEVSNTIVNRYIKSLYEVAILEHKENVCAEELSLIQKSLLAFSNVQKFLKRISLLHDEGERFVDFLINELKLEKIISNFLRELLQNRRIHFLLEICNDFPRYIDRVNGKKLFYVTAARELTKEELYLMKTHFSQVFGGDIDCVIDIAPDLMGGFTVQYKSKILDYSVASRLKRLNSAIKGENYEN